MRYLGIDYGTKRVGIAVSDESASFALPDRVLPRTSRLVETIKLLCSDKKVGAIVLGESKNFKGEDNPIMSMIRDFKKELETEIGLPVHLEPEFLTSAEAERIQGKTKMHDASAAALILQSFLDKLRNNNDHML